MNAFPRFTFFSAGKRFPWKSSAPRDAARVSYRSRQGRARWMGPTLLAVTLLLSLPQAGYAVSPYARSREYKLENVKTRLSFDLGQRQVNGEVTHTISVLQDGITLLTFDSSGLQIDGVTLDGKTVAPKITEDSIVVPLPLAARHGDKHAVDIRYHGQPQKGLYFILPDANYPNQPQEIWSQGEDEDTHFYIPIYDYPNNRTTSEMILTVPADWVTISNGKLVGVKPEANGMKTWDWVQSEPIATYLISVVAGQFDEKKALWSGMPLQYLVPRGDFADFDSTFVRTPDMLTAFSDRLDVRYPWAKYAQSAVDDFVVGGMENASATTLTTRGLVNPAFVGETPEGSDGLISHEMAHQWFGDLVTCKGWADLWLNEGFATYFEHYWTESHYGQDAVDYEYWRDSGNWMRQERLFTAPIVDYDMTDSLGNAGNIYTKGSWVLRMLREKLGDDAFFRGLHAYLETNRYHNVATADLVKSIEGATGQGVDEFFHQWIFGAGAPKFQITEQYDDAAHQVKLEIQQTQEVKGHVGLFHVPVEIEITTASGAKTFPLDLRKADENFIFPVDGPPLMVLLDKGNKILKSVDWDKSPDDSIYQLAHAATVPDRADAAAALGEFKDNPRVIAALGQAARGDAFWGVCNEAIQSLGRIRGWQARNQLIQSLANKQPWVRQTVIEQLGHFPGDAKLAPIFPAFAANDKSWHVRAAALGAMAEMKVPRTFDTLRDALSSQSPDDILRNAALRAYGPLGDVKATPILLSWAAPGKPLTARAAAISALGQMDRNNKDITKALIGYLDEKHVDVQRAALLALVARGDQDAVPALEAFQKGSSLSIGMRGFIGRMIQQLKSGAPMPPPGAEFASPAAGAASPNASNASNASNAKLMKAIQSLQQQMTELNERVKKLEPAAPRPN
jgi:aminopeptidase N